MIRLLYFTRTQERRRDEFFFFWVLEWRRGKGGYIVGVEKILMEGHLMRDDKISKGIMDLDSISKLRESWCIKCRDW